MKNSRPVRARTYLLSLLVVALGPLAANADDTVQSYDIEAQPMGQALKTFATQTEIQVAFSPDTVEGLMAAEVQGNYAPESALQNLIDDTGLNYEFASEKLVVVSARQSTEESEPGKALPASNPVLMAQNQTSASQSSQSIPTTNRSNSNDDGPLDIEEIIVVGSQIRGAGAVGANVITIDREAIELTGLATTQELLETLPQNFGGANEDVAAVGFASGSGNVAYSSSVDLRGLGTASTLMLVNGRRSAPGGNSGSFVDLNSVPLSAIERVEVLADGASAIYGSDAIGGVVNVILRDDYEGAETSLRYAPGTSDFDEIQFSQVFGKSWDTGNMLFTYEYYDRDSLQAADRAYTANSDLTRLGGTNHDAFGGNPGNIVNLLTRQPGWAIPAGQDGTALTPADLIDLSINPDAVNRYNTQEGSDSLPTSERHSAYIAIKQELSNTVELFADIRYSTREFEFTIPFFTSEFLVPSSNAFFVAPPGSPFPFDFVQYDFSEDYGNGAFNGDVDTIGATLGATFALGDDWELEVYGSHNVEQTSSFFGNAPNRALLAGALADSDPATAFNPFGEGSNTNPATLAAIEGFIDRDFESELSVINVLADGDVFDLPGGSAKLAIGGQFRDESIEIDTNSFFQSGELVPSQENIQLDRDVSAVFAELYLPIVSEQNSRPGIRQLAVSIAGRYENYSDFGNSFDPKFGISWSPTNSLTIRSTVGTSFRAPLLTELGDNRGRQIISIRAPDPASTAPDGRTPTIFLTGNNPDLDPQEGTSWTAGFDITPTSLPGLRVGVTYFDTEVDGQIETPTTTTLFAILLDPDIFAPIIRRIDPTNPDDIAAVTALMNDPIFQNSSATTSPDQIGAIADNRLSNLAKAEIAGIDLNVGYSFDTESGGFDLSLYASHLLHFRRQLANGPIADVVDTYNNPVSLRLRGGVGWNNGPVNAALFGNHVSDYEDTLSSPERPIGSWTTWDIQIGYDFSEGTSGILDGAKLSLNVQNLFEKDPPFVDLPNGVGFDAINANSLGRFASLRFTYKW